MIINHNMSASYAQRQTGLVNQAIKKDIGKLSSGLRITTAADDPAGLAVSEKMRAQIRGLQQASRNALDGISMVQTAEGYLQETQNILHRMRELSVQSANGILTDVDRQQISVEVEQLTNEIDRIATVAHFNNLQLLDGTFAGDSSGAAPAAAPADGADPAAAGAQPSSAGDGGLRLHVGANTDQNIAFNIGDMSTTALFAEMGMPEVLTQDSANSSIARIDGALNMVSKQRADLGAYQNRLESSIRSIDIGAENLQNSESRIRNVDMAKQMVDFTRDQILLQAGNSMLAQANVQNQAVLQLLQ